MTVSAKNGLPNVPHNYGEDMRLGDWVYSRMIEYNLLVEGKEPTDARKIEQVENCRL